MIVVVMITPLVWMLLSSLKPNREVVFSPPMILPQEITLGSRSSNVGSSAA